MSDKTDVTTLEFFCQPDSSPLLSVNAGAPVEDALGLCADLTLYVEHIAAADAFLDKTVEAGLIQHLSETAKALANACRKAKGEVILDAA